MIRFYSACMAGPYHIDNGIPCQDSRYIVARDDGIVVAACADGLGSELHSDIGSQIASRTAVTYCAEHIDSNISTEKILKVIKHSFVNAFKAVLEKAEEMKEDIDQFDTTLCLAIYDGETVWYGHSGDSGLIVKFNTGHYCPVTTQQRDEDGCVFPLCSGPEYWVFGKVEGSVSSLMLMTDGVWEQMCHPLLRNEEVKINTALIRSFMEHTETEPSVIDKVEEACVDYLERFPKEWLDDDKTVIVLYNPENPAAEMPEEYYKYPDWNALKEKNRALLYNEYTSDSLANIKENATCSVRVDKCNEKDSAVDKPISNESLCVDEDYKESDEDDSMPQSEVKPPTSKKSHIDRKQRKRKNIKDDQKTTGLNTSLKKKIDIVSFCTLIIFSFLSFFMKDIVQEYEPISYIGVIFVCFLTNASVLLPAQSIFIVVQYALILNPIIVAICGATGAAIGEMVGYITGIYGGNLLHSKIHKLTTAVRPKYLYVIVFCISAVPLPIFDIIGIAAGAMKLNKAKFFVACLCGKMVKMLAFALIANCLVAFLK